MIITLLHHAMGHDLRAQSNGGWVVTLSRRLNTPDGSFSGVVATAIELDYLHELFTKSRIGAHGAVALVRDDGILLARAPYDPEMIGRDLSGTSVTAARRASGGKPFTAVAALDGEVRRYVTAEFTGFPLVVMTSVAEADVNEALGAVPYRIALVTVSLGSVLLLVIWLFRREIARRVAAEASSSKSAELFKTLADNGQDMVTLVGPHGIREYVSEGSWRLLGCAPERLIGQPVLNGAIAPDRHLLQEALEAVGRGRQETASATYRASRDDGRVIWVQVQLREVRDSRNGHLVSMVGFTRDVTAQKLQEEALAQVAERDGLTGLLNRNATQQALSALVAQQRPFSVIAIDLDHFKEVNDAEGHAAGDAVLRAAADRLRHVVRDTDIVARLGGDEFMVLLVGLDDAQRLAEIAGRICEVLHQPVPWHGKRLRTGATLGTARVPHDVTTPGEAVRAADEALIRAKKAQRGSIGLADVSDVARLSRNTAILRAFNVVQDDAEIPGLSVVLQPVVRFDPSGGTNGEVLALEALFRWHHPELGPVPPNELLAAIGPEEGFRIGRAARSLALREFVRLRESGLSAGRLALNLSATEVLRPEAVMLVEQQTIEAGLTLHDIEVEINEDVLIDRVSDRALDQLVGLRRRGARLTLDDFGIGNSGLGQLLRLPLDALKLDRSFVQRLGTGDGRAVEIVKATVSLAHGLGLDMVAVGVETAEQAASLWHMRCDAVQGYLIARPSPPGEVAEWLRNRAPRRTGPAYDPRG